MDTFLIALGFVIVMMMGCALYVLIWEAIDNKKKKSGIDLGDELHQKIVDYLNTDDKDKVTEFIEQTVIDYLKDK